MVVCTISYKNGLAMQQTNTQSNDAQAFDRARAMQHIVIFTHVSVVVRRLVVVASHNLIVKSNTTFQPQTPLRALGTDPASRHELVLSKQGRCTHAVVKVSIDIIMHAAAKTFDPITILPQ